MSDYDVIEAGGVPIKAWTRGVPVEAAARQQLGNISRLPFVFRHVAVMPDVHVGKGATVGSVIPTRGAIVPAAVGVDIGCGMAAVRTNIGASGLPDGLAALRIAVPPPRADAVPPKTIHGDVPSAAALVAGCRFAPRCPVRIAGRCEREEPALLREGERAVACHLHAPG